MGHCLLQKSNVTTTCKMVFLKHFSSQIDRNLHATCTLTPPNIDLYITSSNYNAYNSYAKNRENIESFHEDSPADFLDSPYKNSGFSPSQSRFKNSTPEKFAETSHYYLKITPTISRCITKEYPKYEQIFDKYLEKALKFEVPLQVHVINLGPRLASISKYEDLEKTIFEMYGDFDKAFGSRGETLNQQHASQSPKHSVRSPTHIRSYHVNKSPSRFSSMSKGNVVVLKISHEPQEDLEIRKEFYVFVPQVEKYSDEMVGGTIGKLHEVSTFHTKRFESLEEAFKRSNKRISILESMNEKYSLNNENLQQELFEVKSQLQKSLQLNMELCQKLRKVEDKIELQAKEWRTVSQSIATLLPSHQGQNDVPSYAQSPSVPHDSSKQSESFIVRPQSGSSAGSKATRSYISHKSSAYNPETASPHQDSYYSPRVGQSSPFRDDTTKGSIVTDQEIYNEKHESRLDSYNPTPRRGLNSNTAIFSPSNYENGLISRDFRSPSTNSSSNHSNHSKVELSMYPSERNRIDRPFRNLSPGTMEKVGTRPNFMNEGTRNETEQIKNQRKISSPSGQAELNSRRLRDTSSDPQNRKVFQRHSEPNSRTFSNLSICSRFSLKNENTVVYSSSTQSGRWGTCIANDEDGWLSGIHQWEVKIDYLPDKETRNLMLGIIDVSRFGFNIETQYCGETTNTWSIHFMHLDCYHNNTPITPFGNHFAEISDGSIVKLTLDLERKTLSLCIDGENFGVVWNNLPSGLYSPCVSLFHQFQQVSFLSYNKLR